MGNYQARFWRATALVRESLTLIIRNEGLRILDSGSGSPALGGNARPLGGRRKSTLPEAVPYEERSPRSIA